MVNGCDSQLKGIILKLSIIDSIEDSRLIIGPKVNWRVSADEYDILVEFDEYYWMWNYLLSNNIVQAFLSNIYYELVGYVKYQSIHSFSEIITFKWLASCL